MAYKTYLLNKKVSRFEVQVEVDGKMRFISFQTVGFGTNYDTGYPRFSTSDKTMQEGLEKSKYFKQKMVTLHDSKERTVATDESPEPEVEESGKPEVHPDAGSTSKSYPDVTTFKEAREILTSAHGASQNSVSNAEKVFAVADELGVVFPNLSK